MGPILSVSTKIEIQASPAAVRSVFLDWAGYKKWLPGWKLSPADGAKKALDLKAGDRLLVNMNGSVHQPIVVENSAAAFKWEGSLLGLVSGVHQFHFHPSEKNPGGTTFVQGEDFRGILVTISSPWWKAKSFDLSPWDDFNRSLKSRVENP